MPPKRKAAEAGAEKSKPPTSKDGGGGANKKARSAAAAASKRAKAPDVTPKQFLDNAEEIEVTFGQLGSVKAVPSQFATGTIGWKASTKLKVTISVDGEDKEVMANVSLNMSIPGSKPKAESSNGKKKKKVPLSDEESEGED